VLFNEIRTKIYWNCSTQHHNIKRITLVVVLHSPELSFKQFVEI